MTLKIIFAGNTTLIGRYEDGILQDPRAIAMGQDKAGRQLIGLSPLVGLPSSVQLMNLMLMYDVTDQEMVNLYIKATTNITIAQDLSKVTPIRNN